MTKYEIKSIETFEDNCELVSIFGSGCNYETEKGLEGFDVYFTIEVESREFTIIYQNEDRSDNMKAYCGYGMSRGSHYGADDDSDELNEFLKDNDILVDIYNELESKADALSKSHLSIMLEENNI